MANKKKKKLTHTLEEGQKLNERWPEREGRKQTHNLA